MSINCDIVLLSTSANISGQKTATSLLALTRNFHQELDFIYWVWSANFSPDGKQIVSASREICIWQFAL
jgi:tRNA A37 threonylcarbamoyladenosine synthetase subunit TsaC/SUA5/YrdC